jgi:hypothetical protein
MLARQMSFAMGSRIVHDVQAAARVKGNGLTRSVSVGAAMLGSSSFYAD